MTPEIVDNIVYLSVIEKQQENQMSSSGNSKEVRIARDLASILLLSAFALLSINPAVAGSSEGATLFQSKCAACHSIGKGALVGPDLAPGKSWKDDNLEASIRRMEKTIGALSDTDVQDLMAYLKTAKPETAVETVVEDKSKKAPEETAPPPEIKGGSAQAGSEYFDGRKAFQNGGMSCNACHTLDGSGSSLGPDLGSISERMNEAALLAACRQTPFKVMKASYANHKLTEQEAIDLVKYFESLKGQKQAGEKFPFTLCGAGGTLLIILAVAIGYSSRNSGVRKKLHRR